jgi:GNAT superfamily N-acetyltransferase
MMKLITFDNRDPAHIQAVARVWTAACGPDLAIGERFVAYNVSPGTGKVQSGQLALIEGEPAGLVLASLLQGDALAASPQQGHIDAIAVMPGYQRRSIGKALLHWAEDWLQEQGCTRIGLGASFKPFAPGVPDELGTTSFFQQQGYVPNPGHTAVWDMAHDLASYKTPATATKATGISVRPAEPGQETALLSFLRREFAGGWRYECEELLREGASISDYILLWSDRGVDGCCLVTREDSLRPMDRFYPYRLPRPWGQLGSIGVSADRRGLGYGAALLDGGLLFLRDQGVRGCIIDWLVIVDFYSKFGFSQFRQYNTLHKTIA